MSMNCSEECGSYLPFRGLSAWFSSSVRPAVAKKWDQYGGCYAGEEDADFLFSDNSYSVDTVRVYDTQPSVTVFQSAWVSAVVVKRCSIYDIPLGRYLVLPHYLVQVCLTGDPFKTPEAATLMKQLRGMESSSGGPALAAAGNPSLSQILVRREKRKTGSHNSREERGLGLKNSREYLSSDGPSVGEKASRGGEVGSGCGEGGGSDVVGGGVSVGAVHAERNSNQWRGSEAEAAWSKMMECTRTASLTELQHIDDMVVADHKLIDFNPHLPHFTMRRK